MPTSVSSFAVDTSVAIAAVDGSHAAHRACRAVVIERRPELAGHAAFETMSVLTRMPGPLTVDPPTAAAVLDRMFTGVAWLDRVAATSLLGRLGTVGVGGGAAYDALVGEAARTNGLTLLTRDQRARRTYDLVGVDYEFVG
jgi:predicted nucleic acid-binding protein